MAFTILKNKHILNLNFTWKQNIFANTGNMPEQEEALVNPTQWKEDIKNTVAYKHRSGDYMNFK